jgi:hypothetical protein
MELPLFRTRNSGQIRRDLFDISVGYALIVGALWCPLPWAGLILLLDLAWIGYRTVASGVGIDELGLNIFAVKRDYWLVSAAVLVAAGSAFLALRYDTLTSAIR